MINRVIIPQIFENMEEATIGEWLRREGDTVTPGDALCELITEKTTFQLESEVAGTLRKIVATEKAVVPVGALVAYIGDPNEELPAEDEAAPAAVSADTALPTLNLPSLAPVPENAPAAPAGGRVRATPAARRAAKERGITLEEVAAKFPGKVIGEDDVRAY